MKSFFALVKGILMPDVKITNCFLYCIISRAIVPVEVDSGVSETITKYFSKIVVNSHCLRVVLA